MTSASSNTVCDISRLSQVFVTGEDQNKFKLGTFWQKAPAILIFLRHFACIACRAHAKDVWANRDKYEKAGAQIYFIGNGSPTMIKVFKEDLGLEGAWVFTDPNLEAFHAAGFKRGFFSAYGFKSLSSIRKLKEQGHVAKRWSPEQGDATQLGGILVVKPGGKVTYQYISEYQGDVEEPQDYSP
ncbi:hypothetical protein Bb109J_c0730 [Bdellovibrio bacteriovorus]|uniref:AhpC/TSA family protein n=1 Tax=Bdellovibrio bacteriovorus TaxID=959 RepID=UPI00045BECFA|nr:AhpC/TSA family protein [Bdellovibrio bacteriovorus]AHZ86869.1 hypothetical protein EP01_18295 [Bdellovibrio bacteriovorus]BEV67310.1 hypothetical protein Bb109J_c0730 [Bdellovibrio bacteriovorus]